MAASMKQNNRDEVLLNSGSKSIAINETPKSNKRPLPDSPNDLPATQMQEGIVFYIQFSELVLLNCPDTSWDVLI
jgi:hypothetical protein